MIITREYVGKHLGEDGLFQYYMIKRDAFYGIELVEGSATENISTIEWFSENREKTLALVQLLCLHGASPIHLSEIIDNYVE